MSVAEYDPGKKPTPRGGHAPRARGRARSEHESEFVDKLVSINRVAKVVKGGKNFSFAALVVVGDKKGRAGYGHGKAREVPEAIRKATEEAKKSLIRVPLREGRTLHHDGVGRHGAGKIMLRTAPPGTGLIAGGPMRAVLEVLGVADVVAKSKGSSNPYNMVRATFDALERQESPRKVALRRGIELKRLTHERAGATQSTSAGNLNKSRQIGVFQKGNRFRYSTDDVFASEQSPLGRIDVDDLSISAQHILAGTRTAPEAPGERAHTMKWLQRDTLLHGDIEKVAARILKDAEVLEAARRGAHELSVGDENVVHASLPIVIDLLSRQELRHACGRYLVAASILFDPPKRLARADADPKDVLEFVFEQVGVHVVADISAEEINSVSTRFVAYITDQIGGMLDKGRPVRLKGIRAHDNLRVLVGAVTGPMDVVCSYGAEAKLPLKCMKVIEHAKEPAPEERPRMAVYFDGQQIAECVAV